MSEGYLAGPVAIQPHDSHHGAPHAHHPKLQHHFDDMGQQAEASTLGMWVFLVTEIMFFGGLFLAYVVYRYQSPMAFQEASAHLDVRLGAFNTAVLIFSSLTMAFAVRSAQTGEKPRTQIVWIVLTMILGMVFLVVKYFEYADKFIHHTVPGPNFVWDGQYPAGAEIFYSLYFCMTGLHALHMVIGLGIMTWLAIMAGRRQFNADYYTPVEVSGLYWHFVDIVWIFLFPLLYLIGRHYHAG
ncbi:MAG: cytochrome c oxidase subunit 3 family protein [Vicinamibacterales bacterium]